MGVDIIAVWIGGLLLLLFRVAPLFSSHLNTAAFTAVIRKLLMAGNRDRAIKLCSAAPNAYLVKIVRKILEVSKELKPSDGESLVSESLRETFKTEYELQLKRATAHAWMGIVGLLAVTGASALAFATTEPNPAYAAPVAIAVFLYMFSLKVVKALRVDGLTCGEEIVPLLATHVVSSDS